MESDDYIISIGDEGIHTNIDGYSQLLKFYNTCQNYKDTVVTIDFNKLHWFSGNMCAILSAMIYKLNKERNLNFWVDGASVQHMKKRMGVLLHNGFIPNPDGEENYVSAVELTSFEPNDEKLFVDYIEHKLFENMGMRIDPDTKEMMIDKFLEMYSNIQLHAQTKDPVFACGQYFKKHKTLEFTLVDIGIGYLPPIEEHTKHQVTTSAGAIKWALEGNSTKRDAPGGTGIIDLHKYCKESKSEMNIITGNAYWGTNLPNEETISIEPFCGTIIHMLFNCKYS